MICLLLVLTFLLPIAGAAGETPRTINFSAALLDEDTGKPLCTVVLAKPEDACPREFTLGFAARSALNHPANNGQGVSAETKDRRGELSQSLVGATQLSLLDADIKDIKACIGAAYSPTVVHQAWRMLEGKPPMEKSAPPK